MFNYHANMLEQQHLQHQDVSQELRNNFKIEECDEFESKQIFTEYQTIQKGNMSVIRTGDYKGSFDPKDGTKIAFETADILGNSPWGMAMDKYLGKSTKDELDALLDDVLLETLAEVEAGNVQKDKDSRYGTISNIELTRNDKILEETDGFSAPRTSGIISVIRGPEMVFSSEETNFLLQNKLIHERHLRSTIPVSLYQARVGHYFGKLSMEEMLCFVAASRQSQNYYHYMNMVSQPFFNELTTR